jgi:hypothetical protein
MPCMAQEGYQRSIDTANLGLLLIYQRHNNCVSFYL